MIKTSFRRNIIYLIQLFIHYYFRKIDLIIINQIFEFHDSLIFTFLMVLGEFLGGLAIYIYQTKLFKKKKNSNRLGLALIQNNRNYMKMADGYIKITLLIFFAAFFDFMEFVIATFFIPRIATISATADLRLCSIATIASSLLCVYGLRLKIGKHHVLSLTVMGICIIIIVIFEIIYKLQGIPLGNFLLAYLLVLCYLVFVSFTDIIERYLYEYNFINPFIIISLEGFFGFIMVFIYSYGENPFKDIKKIYNENDIGKFILCLFLLFLYFVFSAGTNIYKIICNIFYSPMAKTLAAYILNPILIIYYFLNENDFSNDGNKNYLYFIINVVLSLIIDFFALVYNEFLILFCCGLEHETHSGISKRAIDNEFELDNKDESLSDIIIEDDAGNSYGIFK